jgi:hypothetical protein
MSFVIKSADKPALVPAAWDKISVDGFHNFNPALISDGNGGFVMAYRFIAESDLVRRIAICRLDSQMNVVQGSAVGLSDLIEFADPEADSRSREWFADPRLFNLQGKTWMVWNDGNRSEGNHQFMVELDITSELKPAGPAREIVLKGSRRKNEKNWAFFEAQGKVWVVYSITPHIILSADLNAVSQVVCQKEVTVDWNSRYSSHFGALRGGAQPVQVGNKFVNLVHSSFNMPEGREYVAATYEFSAEHPFAPVRELPIPVNFGLPRQSESGNLKENKLNPTTSEVVYPTGLVISGEQVWISAGIDDSEMTLVQGTLKDLHSGMVPARSGQIVHIDRSGKNDIAPMSVDSIPPKIPVFWWRAQGNLINSAISHHTFKHGNFGDDASPLLVTRISGLESRRVLPGDKKLLAIGSILHRAKDGDIVWGSGLKSEDALDEHPGGNILVTAVRGPKTLKVLEKAGWDISNVKEMFDPGVLLKHLYADRLAKYDVSKNERFGKIRIVPHFKDELVFKRQRPDLLKHFISPDGDPLRILESMLGAELVVSSSLHGIIFAESLGIPAIWLSSPGGEAQFKYLDYYEGTSRFGIKPIETIAEALVAQPPALPVFDFEKLLATFPAKEIETLANNRKPLSGDEMVGGKARKVYREDFEHATSKSVVDRYGIFWVKGKKGTIALAPLEINGNFTDVTLTLAPARLLKTKKGFTVNVSIDGGPSTSLTWKNGSRDPKQIQLPVSKELWARGVKVSLKASAVGVGGWSLTPKNLGLSVSVTAIGSAVQGK